MIKSFKEGDVFTIRKPLSGDRSYFSIGLQKGDVYTYAFNSINSKPTKLLRVGTKSTKDVILHFLRDKDFDAQYVFNLSREEDENDNLFDIDDI
jgi:hypothetical protein